MKPLPDISKLSVPELQILLRDLKAEQSSRKPSRKTKTKGARSADTYVVPGIRRVGEIIAKKTPEQRREVLEEVARYVCNDFMDDCISDLCEGYSAGYDVVASFTPRGFAVEFRLE
jgi:hypothetical protein